MNTIPSIPLYNYLSSIYPEFKDPTSSERLQWLYHGSTTDDSLTHQLHSSFWRTTLLDCNINGHLGSTYYYLAVDIDKLDDYLYRPDLGKPVSLSRVLDDLKQNKDLITMEAFNQTTTPSWLERMLTRTIPRWPRLPGTCHVFMPSVHTIAHDIVQRQFDRPYSTVNTTLTLTEFRTLYGVYRGTPLTDPDLWLILRYINVNHGVAVDVDVPGYGRSHVAIKFPKHNEHAAFTLADINKSDRAIISLKTTCKALHDQVDELQSKMESLIKQSLDHSNKQQKPQALYALKRKHQLEQVLNRRLKSLETMETLLLKIDASHSDIQIIQAFNMGVDTLKAIFNNNQLTVTSVDETMWRMQATLEEQEQMENMITNGMDTFSENKDQQPTKDLSCPPKRTRDDDLDPIKTVPDSELARLHSILSTIPHAPSTDPPKSKQRRIRQLA